MRAPVSEMEREARASGKVAVVKNPQGAKAPERALHPLVNYFPMPYVFVIPYG
jgi:hypothetical protein